MLIRVLTKVISIFRSGGHRLKDFVINLIDVSGLQVVSPDVFYGYWYIWWFLVRPRLRVSVLSS